MRIAVICMLSAASLPACTNYEGIPAGAENAPEVVPAAAQAPFDRAEQLRIATRACLASELQGPQTLQSLLGQGYTITREWTGAYSYTRMEPVAGKGLFEKVDIIKVSDPNGPIPCDIDVRRDVGYSSFRTVHSEMIAQGYQPVADNGGRSTFTKGDISFSLSGRYSHSEPLATITLSRDTK